MRFATAAVVERGEALANAAHQRFMDEVIRPAMKPAAIELVQKHLDAGDTVVITSATNEFVTAPIARAFGVQHLLATELARDGNGWFTGEIVGIPNMREGKVADEAVQIFGGMGLMDEGPVERIWRNARIERIWEGTSEIQRHIIARELLRPLLR